MAGFLTGTAALAISGALVLGLGWIDVRADRSSPKWTTGWLDRSTHAAVERQSSSLPTFPPPTEDEVIAGGRLYLGDCMGCHGEPGKASEFGATFYPPAPQLVQAGTRYTETQVFWIAKHGIRRTGMGVQGGSYSDEQLRDLAAFITRLPEVPPKLLAAIGEKAETPAPSTGSEP